MAGGTITEQNDVNIDGVVQEGATVTPDEWKWSVDWPAAGSDVWVDQSQSLSPGSYGALDVRPQQVLTVSSGIYYFTSLNVEAGAQINIDASNGPVIFYVGGSFVYKGPALIIQGAEDAFVVGYTGTSPAYIQAPFVGGFVAPNGTIELRRPNSNGKHKGAFFGKNVQVFSDAHVEYMPFNFEAFTCAGEPTGLLGTAGDDQLRGTDQPDIMSGLAGTDLLCGKEAGDEISGGAGRDFVLGGSGDDTITIAAACEVESGEVLVGGDGTDTIISRLTQSELQAAGVETSEFENFLIAFNGCTSTCLAQPACVQGRCIDEGPGEELGCICEPGWEGELCDTPVSPPLASSPRADYAAITTSGTTDITVGGKEDDPDIEHAAFSIKADNPFCVVSDTQSCSYLMTALRLRIGAYSLGDNNFSRAIIRNRRPYRFSVGGALGYNINLPSNYLFGVWATTTGGDVMLAGAASDGLNLEFDPRGAGRLKLDGSFSGEISGKSAEISGETEIVGLTNRPPVAEAGEDQTIVVTSGCTASVALDGSGSSDPDSNIASWLWVVRDRGRAGTSPTSMLDLPAAGSWLIDLTVRDEFGSESRDTVLVNVSLPEGCPTL